MEEVTNYQVYLDKAINYFFEILPNLVIALIILIGGFWVIKFINRLTKKFFDKKDFDPSLETFLAQLINIALKAILFIIVITQLGVESTSLIAVLGSAGLAIGLALQGSLANFAGGILILIFKPFKIGDFISAQGIDGTVKEISIFTTKINTFGNQLAIVPNGQLSNNNIINYNAEKTRRDKIDIGIGYGSNIKKAKEILLQICADRDTILVDPKPEVYLGELADSSVNLTLRFWAKNEDFWAAHFYVLEELKYRFDDANIEIPFPQRVIHQ
ncbi:MAG: mechanosensitive ion channel domain-containing protein [Eudoraea sp.]|uniref:mechanosensitive ion channel family protein n=3 Tax=Eudoraea sp. TaxID=1979955 RepID=UPI003C791724